MSCLNYANDKHPYKHCHFILDYVFSLPNQLAIRVNHLRKFMNLLYVYNVIFKMSWVSCNIHALWTLQYWSMHKGYYWKVKEILFSMLLLYKTQFYKRNKSVSFDLETLLYYILFINSRWKPICFKQANWNTLFH